MGLAARVTAPESGGSVAVTFEAGGSGAHFLDLRLRHVQSKQYLFDSGGKSQLGFSEHSRTSSGINRVMTCSFGMSGDINCIRVAL